jgi:hypothetical protein
MGMGAGVWQELLSVAAVAEQATTACMNMSPGVCMARNVYLEDTTATACVFMYILLPTNTRPRPYMKYGVPFWSVILKLSLL